MSGSNGAMLALHGRLGKDPGERTTSNGKVMATVSVAVDVGRGDADEQPPLWVGVLAFGRVAESLLKHKQGDLVSLAGRLQMNRWKDQEGKDHEQLQVLADSLISARAVRPGGGRRSAAGGGNNHPRGAEAYRTLSPNHSPGSGVPFDDDIPI